MSDLGLQPSEVWKQPGQMPSEGRAGSSENASKPWRCHFLVACLAVFAHVPLVWYSEPSILILITSHNNRENGKWQKPSYFGRFDGGEDDQTGTSASCRNKSHVNFASSSRDFCSEKVSRNGTLKSRYIHF
jgi:hypothetical protein